MGDERQRPDDAEEGGLVGREGAAEGHVDDVQWVGGGGGGRGRPGGGGIQAGVLVKRRLDNDFGIFLRGLRPERHGAGEGGGGRAVQSCGRDGWGEGGFFDGERCCFRLHGN